MISALCGSPPCPSDELGKISVALAAGGEQHQARIVGETQLGADDQMQALVASSDMSSHNPGNRALIGERQSLVTELTGAGYQLLRV